MNMLTLLLLILLCVLVYFFLIYRSGDPGGASAPSGRGAAPASRQGPVRTEPPVRAGKPAAANDKGADGPGRMKAGGACRSAKTIDDVLSGNAGGDPSGRPSLSRFKPGADSARKGELELRRMKAIAEECRREEEAEVDLYPDLAEDTSRREDAVRLAALDRLTDLQHEIQTIQTEENLRGPVSGRSPADDVAVAPAAAEAAVAPAGLPDAGSADDYGLDDPPADLAGEMTVQGSCADPVFPVPSAHPVGSGGPADGLQDIPHPVKGPSLVDAGGFKARAAGTAPTFKDPVGNIINAPRQVSVQDPADGGGTALRSAPRWVLAVDGELVATPGDADALLGRLLRCGKGDSGSEDTRNCRVWLNKGETEIDFRVFGVAEVRDSCRRMFYRMCEKLLGSVKSKRLYHVRMELQGSVAAGIAADERSVLLSGAVSRLEGLFGGKPCILMVFEHADRAGHPYHVHALVLREG